MAKIVPCDVQLQTFKLCKLYVIVLTTEDTTLC